MTETGRRAEIHSQVWVRVNAKVDTGVAGVVNLLSMVPGLQTIQSCQAGEGRPAYVWFGRGPGRSFPISSLAFLNQPCGRLE